MALCLTSRSACRLRWCQVLAVLCGYPLDFTICLQSAAAAEPCSWDLWLEKKGNCMGPLCPHPQLAPSESTQADPDHLGPITEPARTPSESAEPHRNHQAPIRTTWVSSEPPEPHRNPLGRSCPCALVCVRIFLVHPIVSVCVRACAPTVPLASISTWRHPPCCDFTGRGINFAALEECLPQARAQRAR